MYVRVYIKYAISLYTDMMESWINDGNEFACIIFDSNVLWSKHQESSKPFWSWADYPIQCGALKLS